jgi:hypothetical protein
MGKFLRRVAPFAVLAAALSFSAWSLFFVARYLGAPVPVAVVVSTIFDGTAIWLADLAMESAREGDSSAGARFFVFLLAGVSAYLNTLHQQYGGYPADSRILWAAPPIAAVIAYEFTARHIYRKQLRAANVIPSKLPRFDMAAWVLFPVNTMKQMKKIVEHRSKVTTALATGEQLPVTAVITSLTPGRFGSTGGTFGLTPAQLAQLPAGTVPNSRDVRLWAQREGRPVARTGPLPADLVADYLRALSQGEASTAPETASGPHLELVEAPPENPDLMDYLRAASDPENRREAK